MSGGAAGCDGGGATEKHEGDDTAANATMKFVLHEGDDTAANATMKFVKTMMQRMFGHVLNQVHGTKFYEGQHVDFSELMSAIRSCTGAILTEIDLSCHQSEDAFDAFCEDRKMIRYTGFHGTTLQNAKNICITGVDPGKCEMGRWGKGFYVANSAEGTVALLHADTDDKTITSDSTYAVVVCVVAAPPEPTDMFVGSTMQEDFGVLISRGEEVLDAGGRPFVNHILTDPSKSEFCVNDGKAVLPRAIFKFSFACERPTDTALLYSWYPYRFWKILQDRYPDTRARSLALKKQYVARKLWRFVGKVVRKQVRAKKWKKAVRATRKLLARQQVLSGTHSLRPVTRSQSRLRDQT